MSIDNWCDQLQVANSATAGSRRGASEKVYVQQVSLTYPLPVLIDIGIEFAHSGECIHMYGKLLPRFFQ